MSAAARLALGKLLKKQIEAKQKRREQYAKAYLKKRGNK